MSDTEPLDLDLVDDLHARAATWSASAEVRATLAMVPLLTAEIRQLREKLAHRHQDYWTRDALERAGRSKEIRCTPDCAPDYMVVYR